MSDLRELYQEVILDHYKRPRNFGALEEPCSTAQGYNPLCGDQVKVSLLSKDGTIEDVRFEGVGCAITTASASMMTEAVKGRPVNEAEALFESFHKVLIGEAELGDADLGKLEALTGVREYPVRIKCATLPWHALRAAIEGEEEQVTTE
ncbi:MAG: Fe-S cluster assembly sulfur transfer protein SufU [Acidobacteriota bacterium]